MKSKYIAISVAVVLVLVLSGFTYINSVSATGKVADTQKPLKIGIQSGTGTTLLMVAKEKGFFEKEGLNVELEEFTAGKFALQAFLSGSIDMAVSGDVPPALASLQGNEFYIITQVAEGQKNEVHVVATKDGALDTPESYFSAKKRKLATSFGGGPEFYTYNFMKYYNITNVELISQKPEDTPVSLESGSVDAIAIFEPFAFFAEQKLGDKAIVFGNENLYTEFYVLSTNRNWTESNPDKARSLVKALVEASEFIKTNTEEAKSILMKSAKMDKASVDGTWDKFSYNTGLSNKLLEQLNAEAKWAKETGKAKPETQIPDFREMIYDSALKSVDSKSVSI
ncbi:MAG: ABC transporter substrate-binding protein [Candidatus Aenigmarchaeota archaeon]|nr:ABC transporter substrate-binding protein [Candidatus Aenigmarchaeota archaeon]